MRSLVTPLAVIAAFGTDAVVRAQDDQAQDWPRFHLGIAAGQSQLGPDMSEAGVPEHLGGSLGSATGRKVVAGFRPLRVVGVEIQYVDFGEGDVAAQAGERRGSGQVVFWDQSSYMKASANAKVLSALLFVPEASPSFDVYGKVGVADLDESFTASFSTNYIVLCQAQAPTPCTASSDVDQSYSAPYVGFGARFKIAGAAGVRVEYEAVDRDGGDPTTLLSVGIAVEF